MLLSDETEGYERLLQQTATQLGVPLHDVTRVMCFYFKEVKKKLNQNKSFLMRHVISANSNKNTARCFRILTKKKIARDKRNERRKYMRKGTRYFSRKKRLYERRRSATIIKIAKARGIGAQHCSMYLIPSAEKKKIWDEIKGPPGFTKGNNKHPIKPKIVANNK